MREKSTVILQQQYRVENSTPGNYIDESKAIWEEGAARVQQLPERVIQGKLSQKTLPFEEKVVVGTVQEQWHIVFAYWCWIETLKYFTESKSIYSLIDVKSEMGILLKK